jgi:chromosome segregation ATPase
MNWNHEELGQWTSAAKQKEEDHVALERYRRADEQKVKDLELQLEKLTAEKSSKGKQLQDALTSTQSIQIEMDRTVEMLKSLTDSRKEALARWEDTVAAVNMRDEDLLRRGQEFTDIQLKVVEREKNLSEQERFLDQLNSENRRKEAAIDQADRQLAKVRADHVQAREGVTEFNDEMEVVKNQITASSRDLDNGRLKISQLSEGIELQNRKLQSNIAKTKAAEDRLKEVSEGACSKEKAARDAEAALAETGRAQAEITKQTKIAKDNLLKDSQALYKQRDQETVLLGEISGTQSALKNIKVEHSWKYTDYSTVTTPKLYCILGPHFPLSLIFTFLSLLLTRFHYST